MKFTRNLKSWAIFLVLACGLTIHFHAQAQIYAPEGLNMPGSWDNWTNPPDNPIFAGSAQTSGGLLQPLDLGNPIYQTHFFVSANNGNVNPGEYQFKFTSGPATNIWQNQWGAVTVMPNTIQEYTYGVGGNDEPTHNTVQLQAEKWYYVNWDNIGYENTKAVFMELDTEAVEINSVMQEPLLPSSQDQVVISIQASGSPSASEKVYLRYSTNSFSTSYLLPFSFDNNTGTAIIPAMDDGSQISYDVFSTVFNMPSSNFDLVSLEVNNNSGEHYQYRVGDSLSCGTSLALVSTQPVFPLDNSEVILSFNAALGNGGLAGYTGDVYAHTGVITSESNSNSDWKYVKTNWGQNTADTKLSKIDDDLYELIIPNIRDYYGVPAGEEILKIALVFRSDVPINGDKYLEGKTTDNQDIFTSVYDDVLHVKITYPSADQPLLSPNALVPVCVSALQADSIQLFIDAGYMGSSSDENLLYGLNTSGLSSGTHWLIAKAYGDAQVVQDSVMVFLRGAVQEEELPEGMQPGINYHNDHSVTLVLWDPARLKEFAFVLGDFNDWMVDEASYMKRTPDGEYFWVTLDGLSPSTEYAYQYLVDGELKLADPYSDKVLDPWNDKWIPEETYPNLKEYPFGKATGIVSVFETDRQSFDWQIQNFTPQAVNENQSNLVIYELLIRDFVGDSRIASVMDSLDYLKNLGVNAIELLPINEFEGNDSWGYNPSFYFAPDKAYGTINDYKAFVDAAHEKGIAVILDVVFNHSFGQSPMVQMYWDASLDIPSANNPWYNQYAPHPLSPGYDFNHESPYTKAFVKRALTYWMQEYKIDGFRFDLSKGFTQNNTGQDIGAWSQYDQTRVDILNGYYQAVKAENPNAYVILEHLANNDEEVVLANDGMMLWGNMSHEFGQADMGWQNESDYSWAYYGDRGFNYPNLISFMESHDEERMMYNNVTYGNASGDYDVQDMQTAVRRAAAIAPMYFMVPGPKMIWQFGEMGYDYSINYCPDGSISGDCRTSKKPVRWDYYHNIDRQEVYQTYAAMAKLKTSQEAFVQGDFSKDLGGMVKRAWLSHSSLNVCAGTNFDVVSHSVVPNFQHDGLWYNYLTGESLQVSGGGNVDLSAGEFYVYTDQDFGRPYVKLDLTILREEDQSPINGAVVQLQDMVSVTTNAQGKVSVLPLSNQNLAYTIIAGNVHKSGVFNIVEEDLSKTITLKNVSAVNALDEQVKIYPNPTHDRVYLEHVKAYIIHVYTLDGQLVLKKYAKNSQLSISLKSLISGVYV
jgi:1,4-alpha-glucan branching enzyme